VLSVMLDFSFGCVEEMSPLFGLGCELFGLRSKGACTQYIIVHVLNICQNEKVSLKMINNDPKLIDMNITR